MKRNPETAESSELAKLNTTKWICKTILQKMLSQSLQKKLFLERLLKVAGKEKRKYSWTKQRRGQVQKQLYQSLVFNADKKKKEYRIINKMLESSIKKNWTLKLEDARGSEETS